MGNEEFALKQPKKLTFKKFSIFNEDCITSHIYEQKVSLDKPIYADFSVLGLSKLLMYEFIKTSSRNTI